MVSVLETEDNDMNIISSMASASEQGEKILIKSYVHIYRVAWGCLAVLLKA